MIIDVSRWQGLIDWLRVKAAGVEEVVMRCTLGSVGVDDRYVTNWNGARSAGITKRGVYHYFITGAPALAQADNILRVTHGDFGNLPLTIDCERTTREHEAMRNGWVFPRASYTAEVLKLLEALAPKVTHGLQIYTSRVEWNTITTQPPWALEYPLWVAHYNPYVARPDTPTGWNYALWQYAFTGRVAGISGNVDMNRRNPTTPTPIPEDLAELKRRILVKTASIRELVETS